MKILMTIRSLVKNVGDYFTLFNFYDYIQEINVFSRLSIDKSMVAVKFVKTFQKPIKVSSVSVQIKNIIDESFSKPKFYLLRF